VIEAKSSVVKVIVQIIRSWVKGIADLDEKIEEAAAAHRDSAALVGGVWLATRALWQCRGSAILQGDCAGDGEERKKEMGPFPLGLSQVSASEFSRMGRSLHRVLGVGTKLLPATTQQGPGPPCGGTSVGFQMDSHSISLLERRSCLR